MNRKRMNNCHQQQGGTSEQRGSRRICIMFWPPHAADEAQTAIDRAMVGRKAS